MIDIKTIDKAAKIVAKIKELDAEIISIDRMAAHIASNPVKCSVSLTAKEIKSKEDSAKPVTFDEDGSLVREASNQIFFGYQIVPFGHSVTPEKKDDEGALKLLISPTSSMNILAYLLQDLTTKRMELINQIETMGIEL